MLYHGKFHAGYSKKKAGSPAAGLFSGLWIAALCFTVLAASTPALSQSYNLAISSPAFNNNGLIPVHYTCQGNDIIPPLAFKNIPPHTASLVLILEDPDAPGGTFTHWLLWNIDPKTRGIGGHVPGEARGVQASSRGRCHGVTSESSREPGAEAPGVRRVHSSLSSVGRV